MIHETDTTEMKQCRGRFLHVCSLLLLLLCFMIFPHFYLADFPDRSCGHNRGSSCLHSRCLLACVDFVLVDVLTDPYKLASRPRAVSWVEEEEEDTAKLSVVYLKSNDISHLFLLASAHVLGHPGVVNNSSPTKTDKTCARPATTRNNPKRIMHPPSTFGVVSSLCCCPPPPPGGNACARYLDIATLANTTGTTSRY